MAGTWKKWGQDMATGEPNWQADMLKSPAGKLVQPSSAMQKHSLRGLSEKLNTLDGGTNLVGKCKKIFFKDITNGHSNGTDRGQGTDIKVLGLAPCILEGTRVGTLFIRRC